MEERSDNEKLIHRSKMKQCENSDFASRGLNTSDKAF